MNYDKYTRWNIIQSFKIVIMDFPGGPVVKTPPANTGDIGLILGPGRVFISQDN